MSSEDKKQYSAYVVVDKGYEKDIKGELVKLIPSYMVPHKIIIVDEMPLSNNGKFDPSQLKVESNSSHSGASDKTRELQKVHHLFCNILKCKDLGIDDNYFLQGATSLNLIELKFHLESLLNIELPYSVFHQNPTILSLYNNILKKSKEVVIPLKNTNHHMQAVCFHAGRGGCEVYKHLVDCLEGKIFGIEPYNYINYDDRVDDFETLCEIYADNLLLRVELDMPLYFIGWSFGGLLALKSAEMAHKKMPSLRPVVVMLDSLAPSFFNNVITNNTDQLWYGPLIDQLETNNLNQHFIEKHKEVALMHKSMMKGNFNFSYNFPVILFKASQQANYLCDYVKSFNGSVDYNWSKYSLSQIAAIKIDASHESIIEKSASFVIASYINNRDAQPVVLMDKDIARAVDEEIIL